MKKLLISVLMPVFNEQDFLNESIESILNQTYSNLELIIINDGSTDNSISIINDYKDERIKFFNSKHSGCVKQRNFGLSVAMGELIALMDADDISHPDRLLKQYKFLVNNPKIDIVGSNYEVIDKNSKFIFKKHLPEFHDEIEYMMPVLISVCHASILARKTTFDKVNNYNSNYEAIEDHKLFLDLINCGSKIYNIQEPLLRVRIPRYGRFNNKELLQEKLSYSLGLEYLKNKVNDAQTSTEKYNLTYQLALLEYYRGNIKKAQKKFLKSLLYSKKNYFKTFRYLFITLFGQNIVSYMRRIGFLPKLSMWINKITGVDFHLIRR